jgi:hypothetical protein
MDETGFIMFANDVDALLQAQNDASNLAALAAPMAQPDFNNVGAGDAIAVLNGVAATVSQVGSAFQRILQVPADYKFNSAVAAQNQQLGLQTLATAGKIATLQNQTQLARARQEFDKAAGIIAPSELMLVLGVAGVALVALYVMRKK